MKMYRMRHKPTGLYLCPSSKAKIKLQNGRDGYVKTNLSKVGKLYPIRPTLNWLSGAYYNHVLAKQQLDAKGAQSPYEWGDRTFPVVEDEWEVEEM